MTGLRTILEGLDGQGYPAYKSLSGKCYSLDTLNINFRHIQGDPFASPSRIQVDLPSQYAKLPRFALHSSDARRASADFLHRALIKSLGTKRDRSGSGKSGLIEITPVGQELLSRTALDVDPHGKVVLRLSIGLPASGRRILGRQAAQLIVNTLPQLIQEAIAFSNIDQERLKRHVHVLEDQIDLRAQLKERGWIAFLAQGSRLARRSGVDDRPLPEGIALNVPQELRSSMTATHAGELEGLAIPAGVNLIVGGGYHGKSTLISTLSRSVYDHIPSDGREQCVSLDTTVAIRAEDGRSVRGVDLRPFISDLPLGRDTKEFSTDDASGSTSQAAAIVEAIEIGAKSLLIDEDTAATNFMIRDARMRSLIESKKEPITPYIDRIRQLFTDLDISSVLVVGGAGDYLDVADFVIQMDSYQPRDVTALAKDIAKRMPLGPAAPRAPGRWRGKTPRILARASFNPSRGRRDQRIRSIKTRSIEFGREEIDVSQISQLVDPAQCRMIGDVLALYYRELCNDRRSICELLDILDQRIERDGLSSVAQAGFGDRAQARRFEIAGALNRLRSLIVSAQ